MFSFSNECDDRFLFNSHPVCWSTWALPLSLPEWTFCSETDRCLCLVSIETPLCSLGRNRGRGRDGERFCVAARLVVTANQMIRLTRVGVCGGSGESLQGGRCKVILGGGREKNNNQRWCWVALDVGNRTLLHTDVWFSLNHTREILSFKWKSHSNVYLYARMPPFSSSLVYFWEMSGSAASLLWCVGHDCVKCFPSNLALLLQLPKEAGALK